MKGRRWFSNGAVRVLVATTLVWLFVPLGCSSQQNADQEPVVLAKAFASEFYASYRAHSERERPSGIPAWAEVARDADSVLTSELAEALSTDYEEAQEFPDEIAGLDFDPFLASQDPCDTYRVERTLPGPTGFRVEVYGDCTDAERRTPNVIAEVIRVSGGFRFANFYYPGPGTDLLTVLRRLRDERR